MQDFLVLDKHRTQMEDLRAVVAATLNPDTRDKRIVVTCHLDKGTIEDVFKELAESGQKPTHRHVVFAVRKDGKERTWFCRTRDQARTFVGRVKDAHGTASYWAVPVK